MPNQQVPQGTLNRLRGSVVIPNHPELNVTAPFLGDAGITLSFSGEAVDMIPTMTGTITSPQPFLMASVRMELLKTQNLANLYKKKMENDATLGDVTITTDAATLDNYNLTNCAIANMPEITVNGKVVGYAVTLSGYYSINASLWEGS